MSLKTIACIFAAAMAIAPAAYAQQGQGQGRGQPGMGPVAQHCGDDLAQFCPGIEHANRAGRTCLEKNIQKVSAACRNALNTTGGGKGRNR